MTQLEKKISGKMRLFVIHTTLPVMEIEKQKLCIWESE